MTASQAKPEGTSHALLPGCSPWLAVILESRRRLAVLDETGAFTRAVEVIGASAADPSCCADLADARGLGEHITNRSAATVEGIVPASGAKLEPDAIGAAQDTIICVASSAPAATVGLSLAAPAAAIAYGSGPILLITAVPMLIIANAYRRRDL